ncbi:hypothetical protein AALB16_13200 [Lachnospiraceae bacterium 62-35]
MNFDLSAEKQIPINILCFSDDGKTMYGFAKYYNEFFEINLLSHTAHSLGQLNGEKDSAELIFLMACHNGMVIFIPRLAEHLHIYDSQTGKRYHFNINDILGGNYYNFAGFFFCIYDKFLYLIHRDPIIISKLNLETFEHTVVSKDTNTGKHFLSLYNQVGKYAACFDMDKEELLLFDAEKESFRQIMLPKECAGFARPFFDGEFIWLYHFKNNMVYKCDMSGKVLRRWQLEHDMDGNGLHMVFRMIDGNLYLFPNKQDCYFSIKNDEIIMHQCKSIESDICWLAGDDGKNPYYICIEWNKKGDCPTTTMCSIMDFKYKMLNLIDKNFIDIPVNLPMNPHERERVVRAYQDYFSGGMARGENTGTLLTDFLSAIIYMEPKSEQSSQNLSKIGETIFQKVSS